MSAAEILKMIEAVSPDDTVKLDEIDVRVSEYLKEFSYFESTHGHYSISWKGNEFAACYPDYGEYTGYCPRSGVKKEFPRIFPYSDFKHFASGVSDYTRSRDALKAIRPDKFAFMIANIRSPEKDRRVWECAIARSYMDEASGSFGFPTEELAELHAIIQATEYERKTPQQGSQS